MTQSIQTKESTIEIILRVFLATLFIFSGISKLDPIYGFEKQLVDMGVASWSLTPYLSRTLIALEIIIGGALLDRAWFKKVILPGTALLLIIFTTHLVWQGFHYGFNNGNCGCFGDKLPMTPLEAILKNIVTLGAVGFLFYKAQTDRKDFPISLLIITLGVFFWTFLMYPANKYQKIHERNRLKQTETTKTPVIEIDSSSIKINNTKIVDSIQPEEVVVDPKKIENEVDNTYTADEPTEKKPLEPIKSIEKDKEVNQKQVNKVITQFAPFTQFSSGTVDLDKGDKLICLFNASCSHCQATAKDLCDLKATYSLPDIYILLDGDPFFVDFFFDEAGCRMPYQTVEPDVFYPLLDGRDYPWIIWKKDGKTIKEWDLSSYTKDNFEASFKGFKK